MKKALIIAVLMMVGTGVALASSLGLPWYIDNADINQNPSNVIGVMGIVYLHNNTDANLTANIVYFDQEGTLLVPTVSSTTFNISPNASIAFRPVADDPDGTVCAGCAGQEGAEGNAVPDRPRDVDTKKNGSLVITWAGASTDIQGAYQQYRGSNNSLAFLLPAGN